MKNNKQKPILSIITFAIVSALVLASCADSSYHMQDGATIKSDELTLLRVVDEEAGVVCYATSRNTDAGVSCLPISETRLDQ